MRLIFLLFGLLFVLHSGFCNNFQDDYISKKDDTSLAYISGRNSQPLNAIESLTFTFLFSNPGNQYNTGKITNWHPSCKLQNRPLNNFYFPNNTYFTFRKSINLFLLGCSKLSLLKVIRC